MKTRDFRHDGSGLAAFYPGTDILMYRVNMSPIGEDARCSLLKKGMLNLMRTLSGLCYIVNENALNGRRGTAAMIDYINAEQLHGKLDKMFMYGSVDSVRSRIRKIEEITKSLAQDVLQAKKRGIGIFEAGCGFIRIPLGILSSIQAQDNSFSFYYLGVDKEPQVVEVCAKIVAHEKLHEKIVVANDDALESLETSDRLFDLIIAEGAMEYWDKDYCNRFVREAYKHLHRGGHLSERQPM